MLLLRRYFHFGSTKSALPSCNILKTMGVISLSLSTPPLPPTGPSVDNHGTGHTLHRHRNTNISNVNPKLEQAIRGVVVRVIPHHGRSSNLNLRHHIHHIHHIPISLLLFINAASICQRVDNR